MTEAGRATSLRERIRGSLSQGAKDRIARVLCHPLTGRAIAAIGDDRVRSGGHTIRTDNPAIAARTKAQIFWGIYESAEIRFVHRHLRPDRDVLEIGSSLGVVSTHALGRLYPDSNIVCVEANPSLIPTIEANLTLNFPNRRVRVLNRALDYESRSGSTTLRTSTDTSASRLGRLESSSPQVAGDVEVPSATIASIVAECGLREYSLISDIEGAEVGFIRADRRELEGCRSIIIELHDTEHAGRRFRWQDLLAELVERFGFRVVDGFGPVQVLER